MSSMNCLWDMPVTQARTLLARTLMHVLDIPDLEHEARIASQSSIARCYHEVAPNLLEMRGSDIPQY